MQSNDNYEIPKPPVVKHAFNMKAKVSGVQLDMHRAGPVGLLQDQVKGMVLGLDQLSGSEKFPEFVAAARLHGVKIILTLAVEEPAK